MKNIIRLIKLLSIYPRRTLGGLIAIVASNCVSLSIPWITRLLIDQLEEGTATQSGLIKWGVLILFLAAMAYAAKQVWRHLILGAARRIEARLRNQLLEKTLSLSPQAAQTLENGKFMALCSNDIPAVGQALAFGVIAFFDSIFITVVAFFLMFRLSPTLTFYSIIPFPILAVLMLLSLKLIYKRWDKVQQSMENLTEKTRESLTGMRTLRAYVQGSGDEGSFAEFNESYRKDMLGYVRIDATFSPLILLFAGTSSAVLLYFGGQLVVEGTITVGTMAAFVGYLALLTWPMIAAGWMLVLLQRGAASIARLDKLFEEESEVTDGEDIQGVGALEVRDLTFSYPESEPVLEELNIKLEPGQTLGVVGPVGCGKSTLLRLLQRLEQLPANSAFIGESDLSVCKPKEVRKQFSYVSQEPFLFSDTIENNLRLGHPEASPEQLAEAVKLAALADDLSQFPDGLQTMLGERGVSLSGGQKQRTALARALLAPSPILLLDDTLSAVDTLTEKKILAHLQSLAEKKERTLIIAGHRLSAVEEADEIIVLKEGQTVDRGSHQELSSRPGLYQDLLTLQTEDSGDALV